MCAMFLLLALASIQSATAGQQVQFYHGSICQPVNTSRNIVDYGQFGAHNLSSTATATVECALPTSCPVGITCRVDKLRVQVWDRNANANVQCTLNQLDGNGQVLWQQLKGSVGGGIGAGPQTIVFTPGGTTWASWNVRCTVPPSVNGWFTHIASINFDSTQ